MIWSMGNNELIVFKMNRLQNNLELLSEILTIKTSQLVVLKLIKYTAKQVLLTLTYMTIRFLLIKMNLFGLVKKMDLTIYT